jgi:hypothetical protein
LSTKKLSGSDATFLSADASAFERRPFGASHVAAAVSFAASG